MHNKKILGAIAALTVSVTLIGGTLAWLTSYDNVKNTFATGSVNDPNRPNDPDAGIDIEENFDEEKADKLLPGGTVTKEVKVTSTANYDQYLRAKITKVWKDKDGNVVTHYKADGDKIEHYNNPDASVGAIKLDDSKIHLNLATPGSSKGDNWTTLQEDGYYYYNQLLSSEATTSELLKSVTFATGVDDNYYKNLKFDVIVEAEGMQATQDAAVDGWSNIPNYIKELGK